MKNLQDWLNLYIYVYSDEFYSDPIAACSQEEWLTGILEWDGTWNAWCDGLPLECKDL